MNPSRAAEDRIAGLIEQSVGGRVVSIAREGRWRPSWQAVVEREGQVQHLYVRGDRGDGYSYPLEREAAVLTLLERHRVAVPHVFGMIDDPKAIVMDFVAGTGQLSGIVDVDE